jgi:hypothetical protein
MKIPASNIPKTFPVDQRASGIEQQRPDHPVSGPN